MHSVGVSIYMLCVLQKQNRQGSFELDNFKYEINGEAENRIE